MFLFSALLASRPCGRVHSFVSVYLLLLTSMLDVGSIAANTTETTSSLAFATHGGSNFQLVRLDASGTLTFSQSINNTWQPAPDIIALTVKPKPNSPLGLISWSPSGANGDTSIRAYYLDTANRIIELVGVCQDYSCKWKNNNGLVGVTASPSSALAAALAPGSGAQWGINVFYVGADSLLSLTSYTKGTLWLNGTAIGPKVAPNSSLAVSIEPDKANYQVYFHTDSNNALSFVSFDSATSAWSSATPISGGPSSTPLPSLAAIALPSPLSRRLYFINSTRHLEALSSSDNGATWSAHPQSGELLPRADAPGTAVAAVSWATKVRLFYTTNATLTETSMKGTQQLYVMGVQGFAKGTTTAPAPTRTGSDVKNDKTPDPTPTGAPDTKKEPPSGDAGDSDNKTTGGMPTDRLIAIVLTSVGTFFTVAGAVWKWKWLQKTWRKCRGPSEKGPWLKI